jgi:hypothetical protein
MNTMQPSVESMHTIRIPKEQITPKDVFLQCKEVKFPDKSYSKLVTPDGQVAIVYSPLGDSWSLYKNKSIRHQLIFDSRIILSLFSPGMRWWSKKDYIEFMESAFSDVSIDYLPDFSVYMTLRIEFIPENTIFRIHDEYEGREGIEIYNPNSYFTS